MRPRRDGIHSRKVHQLSIFLSIAEPQRYGETKKVEQIFTGFGSTIILIQRLKCWTPSVPPRLRGELLQNLCVGGFNLVEGRRHREEESE